MNEDAIFIFAREPSIGKVKTRLAKNIGNYKAYKFYLEFLKKTIENVKKILQADRFIFYHSKSKRASYFKKYGGFILVKQMGETFNKRLSNCFSYLFKKGYKRVIVLASDSPDLPKKYLLFALKNLKKYDAVIGETEDGGYYLLGLKDPSILGKIYSIESSTTKTSQKIKKCLSNNNKKYKEIGKWYDIDTFKDLKKYLKKQKTKRP